MTNKNRIMIYGPKNDAPYVVEFKTAEGEALAISIPEDRNGTDSAFPEANALRAVRAP